MTQTRRCFGLKAITRRSWLFRAGAPTSADRNGPLVPLGSNGSPKSCTISFRSVQLDGVHSCRLLHLASQQGVQKCSISCQIKRFDFRRPSTFAFGSIWDTVDFRSCRSRCKIFNGMLLLWRKQSNLHLQRCPLQQKKLSVSPVLCVARLVPSSARQTPVLSPAELPIAVTSGRSL